MLNQKAKVKKYFDLISSSYIDRFTHDRPYHNYFFRKRLSLATKDYNFEGKSIIDIGAGTGILYDYLNKNSKNFEYFGCDISGEMLAQSRIPSSKRFVGSVTDFEFPDEYFDFIYLLGVTSYMTDDEMNKVLNFISAKLKNRGNAIISFANKSSIDFYFRKVILFFVNLFKYKKGVIGQNFRTNYFTEKKINDSLPKGVVIKKIEWFNFTFTPFNQLFPNLSIKLSDQIEKWDTSPTKQFLGSNFLVTLHKKI